MLLIENVLILGISVSFLIIQLFVVSFHFLQRRKDIANLIQKSEGIL